MAKAIVNGGTTPALTLASNTGPTTAATYAAPTTGARHDDGHT